VGSGDAIIGLGVLALGAYFVYTGDAQRWISQLAPQIKLPTVIPQQPQQPQPGAAAPPVPQRTSTGGGGGNRTDRTNLSFTGSGYTSTYHLYAGGLDWSNSVGLLVYTDGSAEYGLKNPKDSYLMAGGNGMIAVAKKHNMVLLTPFAPNKSCADGDGSCWYQGDPPGYTRWLESLIRQVQSQYPIDRRRVAFGGYSSGAQLCTEYWVPSGAAQRTMTGGVIVAISFGGSPKMAEVAYTPAFKSNVHMNWNVGQKDDAYLINDETEGPAQGYNAKAGYDHYTRAGFKTSINVIPNADHDRDGEFGGIMDAQISSHVAPAGARAMAAAIMTGAYDGEQMPFRLTIA